MRVTNSQACNMKHLILYQSTKSRKTMQYIPYHFDTPIPSHFRKIGWLKDPRMIAFLYWIFQECHPHPFTITIDFTEIALDSYEFYYTRTYIAEKSGLSEYEVRRQMERIEHHNYAEQVSEKSKGKYRIYKWSKRIFSKHENQEIFPKIATLPPDKSPDLLSKNHSIPVSEQFLARKSVQYSKESIDAACLYYIARFIQGPFPSPSNVNGWFNDCLRRRYWEEEKS